MFFNKNVFFFKVNTTNTGSSNSQDSFPAAGSSGASMDGYGGYPGSGGGYPPGANPDYNSPTMQRPPSQNNTQTPHPGNYIFCFEFIVY